MVTANLAGKAPGALGRSAGYTQCEYKAPNHGHVFLLNDIENSQTRGEQDPELMSGGLSGK